MSAAFELEDILPILPHRAPFLFIDRVVQLDAGRRILAERMLRPEEPYFAGHFPGQPMMPGVLVTEALAQASGLLLGLTDKVVGSAPPAKPKSFLLARTSIKFAHPALPGEVLQLQAILDRSFAGLFRFDVEASTSRGLIASGSLTLGLVNPTGA
jgi:3-hydroxyacyl-[acyl-carrier-protein] dehydratase